MELEIELKKAADLLKSSSIALSVSSGCELFTRFVTRASLDIPVRYLYLATLLNFKDFVECKKILIERGHQYTRQSASSRIKIGQLFDTFLREGTVVLTHGLSRVVLSVLLQAAHAGRRFHVIVTEARPDQIGYHTAKRLQEAAPSVSVSVVMDSAVARILSVI